MASPNQVDLLELKVTFGGLDVAAKRLRDEVAKANASGDAEAARKKQAALATVEKFEQNQRQRARQAQAQLIEHNRRLAIESIRDESRRRQAMIQAEYEAERKNIQSLLRERLRAGQITQRQAREQQAGFDAQLRGVRDAKLAAVPKNTLMGKAGQGLAALGLDAGMLTLMGAGTAGVAALTTGLTMAIDRAVGFEAAMSKVGRTTGLEGAELKGLGADLLDLSARLGVSQENLVGIAETAGSLGIQGRQNILAFTETVAKFSVAADMSAEEAASALAKIGSAFGIPVEQSANLGSAIDTLADTTAARSQDIVSALTLVGAAGRQAGMSAPQVAALAATLIDAGVDASTAGTSIRNVLTLMQTEADKVAKVAGMSRGAWLDAFSKDPLAALNTYLGKLRELAPTAQAIHIEDAFGRENVVAVSTLAVQTEKLSGALAASQQAFADGTRLNQSFATSQATVSAQWAIFTANLSKTATEIGSSFLPGIAAGLSALNGLAQGAEDTQAKFGRLNDEMGRVESLSRLRAEYERLSSRLATLKEGTEEHRRAQIDLNGVAAQIGEIAPGVVTAYDNMGRASAIRVGQLDMEIGRLRERNRLERELAAREAASNYAAARRRAAAAATEGQDVQGAARGRANVNQRIGAAAQMGGAGGLGVGGTAAAAALAAATPESRQEIERESARIAQNLHQTATAEAEARDALVLSIRETVQGLDAVKGSEGFRAAVRQTQAIFRDRGLPATEENATFFINRARALSAAPTAPPPQTGGGTGPGDDKADRAAERARDKAEQARERADDARTKLQEKQQQARADAVVDELQREEDAIRARYQRERNEIADTDKAFADGGAERQAALDAVNAAETRALEAVAEKRRERDFQEREQAAQLADERLRIEGHAEEEILAGRLGRLQAELTAEKEGTQRKKDLARDVARAQLDLDKEQHARRQRLAQLDRDAAAETAQARLAEQEDANAAELLTITNTQARERRSIEIRRDQRIAAAEQAANAGRANIKATAKDAEERERRLAAVKRRLTRETADAQRDEERETAEYQARLDQERLDRATEVAGRIFDVVVASLGRERRMTDAQAARERRGYAAREQDLRESYRNREMTTQAFNDSLSELQEQRAAFEEDRARESAGVLSAIMLGLLDVGKDVALQALKTSLLKAAAKQIEWLATLGPLGLLGAGAAVAAVFALESQIRKQAGFQAGGFTGYGPEDEVAGLVHRGEMVIPARGVRGDVAGWEQVRRLAEAGVTPSAFLGRAATRAALSPALPSTGAAAAPAYDARLLAATERNTAELQALRRDLRQQKPLEVVENPRIGRSLAEGRERYAAAKSSRRQT